MHEGLLLTQLLRISDCRPTRLSKAHINLHLCDLLLPVALPLVSLNLVDTLSHQLLILYSLVVVLNLVSQALDA